MSAYVSSDPDRKELNNNVLAGLLAHVAPMHSGAEQARQHIVLLESRGFLSTHAILERNPHFKRSHIHVPNIDLDPTWSFRNMELEARRMKLGIVLRRADVAEYLRRFDPESLVLCYFDYCGTLAKARAAIQLYFELGLPAKKAAVLGITIHRRDKEGEAKYHLRQLINELAHLHGYDLEMKGDVDYGSNMFFMPVVLRARDNSTGARLRRQQANGAAARPAVSSRSKTSSNQVMVRSKKRKQRDHEQTDPDSADTTWTVRKLLRKRPGTSHGRVCDFYLVEWEGAEAPSWQPESCIVDRSLIDAYEQMLVDRRAQAADTRRANKLARRTSEPQSSARCCAICTRALPSQSWDSTCSFGCSAAMKQHAR